MDECLIPKRRKIARTHIIISVLADCRLKTKEISLALLSPLNRPVNMMDRSKERGDFEADFRNFMIAKQNKRTSDASARPGRKSTCNLVHRIGSISNFAIALSQAM